MTYLKYTPYLFLIAALLFIYDGIVKLGQPEGSYAFSFFIAAICIFMFFFRMSFVKRLEKRNKK